MWVEVLIPSLTGYEIALTMSTPLLARGTALLVLAATALAGRAAAARATRAPILEGFRNE